MPEPSAPRRSRPFASALILALFLAAVLVPSRAAAADPTIGGRVASPTRSGVAKGSGTAPEPETTGRLIVRYAEGVSAADRGRIRAAHGLQIAGQIALPRTEVVTPTADNGRVMVALARSRDVEWVQPEHRLRIMAGPTGEPLFGAQWGLDNTGQEIQTFPGVPDVDMNVPEAWAVTQGSPSVVVAVIDSGVDISHPDLAGQLWTNPGEIANNGIDDDGNGFADDVHGWDFCDDDSTVFEPGQRHGTHVAGSIAAGGNGIGIAGVAPKVKIMVVRFIDDTNDGTCGTDVQAVNAIRYAVAEGARIVNASWGEYGINDALADAIADAPNTLFVAAAGNDDVDTDQFPVSPASIDLPNILSVAAIHNQGYLSAFTNFGVESVDLAAPGEDILSLLPGGAYGWASGTSMATPHVTGVAALAASARPSLLGNAPALRAQLIRTARALPTALGWIAYPRMVDARAAVVARPDVVRLFGADRYATAAAISKATFIPHLPYVFVATGADFPDALAGGALAAQVGAPVLLVSRTSIPTATQVELARLKPRTIVVLGGTAVISGAVQSALAGYAAEDVLRLAGADRYATAAAIADAGFSPGVPTAFVSTGSGFPDALAGTPAAAALGGPLLLVTRTSIPAATKSQLSALRPQRIVILGGTSVVSSTVAAQLDPYTAGPVSRWAGADRFATAGAIAANAFPSAGSAFVANGLGFPDALAGGPSGGAYGGPLLLVSSMDVPSATGQQLKRLAPARIFVLGGPAVVGSSVVTKLKALFP